MLNTGTRRKDTYPGYSLRPQLLQPRSNNNENYMPQQHRQQEFTNNGYNTGHNSNSGPTNSGPNSTLNNMGYNAEYNISNHNSSSVPNNSYGHSNGRSNNGYTNEIRAGYNNSNSYSFENDYRGNSNSIQNGYGNGPGPEQNNSNCNIRNGQDNGRLTDYNSSNIGDQQPPVENWHQGETDRPDEQQLTPSNAASEQPRPRLGSKRLRDGGTTQDPRTEDGPPRTRLRQQQQHL
jgi:hypothetical protein